MCSYHSHVVVSNNRWKFSYLVISNVIHKQLDNMWHFVQLELPLYIVIANVHVLMVT